MGFGGGGGVGVSWKAECWLECYCRGEEIGQVLICMVGWLVVVVSWVGDGMDGMGWSSQIVMP
jgi:hypothetical protein